ncbi:hypothetical protein LCGC14_0442390 [marine sediment metagenome]|uniref:Uncharacterized protein n=1 Tax=marine sediment metagenome TaxID=412755 RepID=A0A0F9SQP4_9ZZZZ
MAAGILARLRQLRTPGKLGDPDVSDLSLVKKAANKEKVIMAKNKDEDPSYDFSEIDDKTKNALALSYEAIKDNINSLPEEVGEFFKSAAEELNLDEEIEIKKAEHENEDEKDEEKKKKRIEDAEKAEAKKKTAQEQPDSADLERRMSRARRGREETPPAHHDTAAPAGAADRKREREADPDQKPAPVEEPTQKRDTLAGETARAEERTRASAPDAQPTDNARPRARAERTTPPTRGEEEEARDRDPPNRTRAPGGREGSGKGEGEGEGDMGD